MKNKVTHAIFFSGPTSIQWTPKVEVLSKLDVLLTSRDESVREVGERRRERDRLRADLESAMLQLSNLIRRSGSSSSSSTSSSSSNLQAVKGDLQRAVRAFEVKVLEAANRWEEEKRRATATPEQRAQRKLWIDFMLNPKVSEQEEIEEFFRQM